MLTLNTEGSLSSAQPNYLKLFLLTWEVRHTFFLKRVENFHQPTHTHTLKVNKGDFVSEILQVAAPLFIVNITQK